VPDQPVPVLEHELPRRAPHVPDGPYYRLPELHEEVKGDLAPAYPSIWAAYKEIIPAVWRQLRDQEYYVRRELPPGAPPYYQPAPINDSRALPLAVPAAA